MSVEGGVIDPDYTGEVQVIVQNNGVCPFYVRKGMKIGQLVLLKFFTPEIKEVEGTYYHHSR